MEILRRWALILGYHWDWWHIAGGNFALVALDLKSWGFVLSAYPAPESQEHGIQSKACAPLSSCMWSKPSCVA